MKKILIAILVITTIQSCTNENSARRLLEKEGYTNIQFTGYRPFMCSEDDQYKTGFSATNRDGQTVTGCVCEGLFKGKTLRFD